MATSGGGRRLWGGAVRQVTKSDFAAALEKLKDHVRDADFVAVSFQNTGDSASSASHHRPWRRVAPIDTPQIAYLKAKLAAETFELLQFAVCPFRIDGSKVVAFPYNFLLFPRDEMNLGMPSYSFSCQTSYLTCMAREGFDFNAWIYDGISYLSRAQEPKAKERILAADMRPHMHITPSSPNLTIADSIFMGRVKSRIAHWLNACKDSGKITDGPLVQSLRNLIFGGEVYGLRPCTSVDVCSDRQVWLAFETVNKICDDLVPLVVPDQGGGARTVRVVLTSSKEDKNLLMAELKSQEEEQNLKVRGFREVIDVISSSHKPIVAYNCLHDFTFIHSKFLAPLPSSLAEFKCSLRLAFSNIIDVNHLLKEVGPLRKAKNLHAAISYLKRQFFVPIHMEMPQEAEGSTGMHHGHKVLRITHLFAKLINLLKIVPGCQASLGQRILSIEEYANTFYPSSTSLEEVGDDTDVWMDSNIRRTSSENLVFLWGFTNGISSAELKHCLHNAHSVFAEEDFQLQLVDKTCAVVVFSKPDSAESLLNDMRSGNIASGGLKAAGYEAYTNVCRLGLWESDLADSLDTALLSMPENDHSAYNTENTGSEVYWSCESVISLSDL